MDQEFEFKANYIKEQIKKDFKALNETELVKLFEEFLKIEGNLSFIEFYNQTVLNKQKINFGTFKKQWAIQGMTKDVFNFFSNNFDKCLNLKKEIENERNIKNFYKSYCCKVRKEVVFCSKLFHTILPDEFPPVDNFIIGDCFQLQKGTIDSVLIIQRGYLLFIKEHKDQIGLIRELLSTPTFSALRIKELSDIRILDMYYWYQGKKKEEAKKILEVRSQSLT